jgi:hypothetical protein
MGKYLDMVAHLETEARATKETNKTRKDVTEVVGHNQEEDLARILRLFRSSASPNARPDLQTLVQSCGGYHRIPPEVWEVWDREVAAWKERVRRGDKYWPASQPKERKPND